MAQSGYTPILIYASGTASAVPSASNLTSSASGAELALNYADGKLYYKNSSGTVTVLAGAGGTGIVAGSNTQIQFNNSGVFGASSSLTWDGTYLTAGSIKDSALTSGRVTYAGASGLLTDSASLTFNGTTLTAGGFTTTGTTSTGVLSVTGNTTLGDASADTVTVNGTITSNLIFTDNTYDIGASGATRPRSLYLGTNLVAGGNAKIGSATNAVYLAGTTLGLSATFEAYNQTYGAIAAFRTVPSDGINPYFLISTSAGGITLAVDGSSYRSLIFKTSNTEVGRFTTAGNLVVGSTANIGRIGSALSDANTSLSSLGYGMLGLQNTSNTANNYTWMTFNESNGNYVGAIGTQNISHASGSANVYGDLVFATKTYGAGGFPTEKMRIFSTGSVAIGTGTPYGLLTVYGSDSGTNPLSSSATVRLNLVNSSNASAGNGSAVNFQSSTGTNPVYAAIAGWMQGSAAGGAYGDIVFGTKADYATVSPLERMRITAGGQLLVGTTTTSGGELARFETSGNTSIGIIASGSGASYLNFGDAADANVGFIGYDHTNNYMSFRTNGGERIRVSSTGNVSIGTTANQSTLQVLRNGFTNPSYSPTMMENAIASFSGGGGDWLSIGQYTDSRIWIQASYQTSSPYNIVFQPLGGSVIVTGALSKGSGSFRISHPLPELEATHELVHSFIEGPQADLIYRGKVTLVNGVASVNIDLSTGMTEGTFVALNRDVQCFTTNESGWSAVRGSVSGNVLTIEAQDNTCSDTISWMVIGERQDKHMYETEWTDENGKVILEPLKPESERVTQ